jgi:tetratricopeptide (TPR) repeat protein
MPPASASSLVGPSAAPSASTDPSPPLATAAGDDLAPAPSERDVLVRDALFLDFAGYHAGADLVVRKLRARDPSDPLAALIEVEHRFWPQLYDVGPVRDDPELVAAIASALELARADYEAHPDDLRARALYGRALLHDARRLALDGYLMRAGAQSENARAVLEQVVERAPGDQDSRYLLGNYYYWAGVLPAFLKYINWLWFVPQGDREEGLVMLQEVSRSPSLYAESAQVMLSVIGSHHAPTDFEYAARLLRPLHERYPKNVLILHELVDVTFKLGRYDELETLLDRMQERAAEPQPARAYGLVTELWRARIALHRRHLAEAERRLDEMAAYESELPNWSHAWIDVLRGQIADLRGQRKLAKRHYEHALERKGIYESQRASRMARKALETPFDPDRFEHPLLSTN